MRATVDDGWMDGWPIKIDIHSLIVAGGGVGDQVNSIHFICSAKKRVKKRRRWKGNLGQPTHSLMCVLVEVVHQVQQRAIHFQ